MQKKSTKSASKEPSLDGCLVTGPAVETTKEINKTAKKSGKNTTAKKSAVQAAKVTELSVRQALMAIPLEERQAGKFPAVHALGAIAKLFGAKPAENGSVQLPLDKARTVKLDELAAVCPKDTALNNTLKVLSDYGKMAGKWHVKKDNEAVAVVLVPGTK